MCINLNNYFYDKFLTYSINKKCYRSFKKNRKSIKESIDKIIDDHNEYILTESFIDYLTDKDLYMKLSELATNDKYLIYELIGLYYQELSIIIGRSEINSTIDLSESALTQYLDLETREVIKKVNSLFTNMCRINGLNIYYFSLMKLTVFYILTYCHLNCCMDKYDDMISYYEDDIYKLKDEIIINGIDIADSNKELIDMVSMGLINKNKKIIK